MFRIWVRGQIQGSKARLDMKLCEAAGNNEKDAPPKHWAVDKVGRTPEAGIQRALSASEGSLKRQVADCLS